MEHPVEADVYLDTDVLVNLVYGELPHAAACRQASQVLYDAGSVVYVSAMAHIEFAQAFRTLATKRVVADHLIEDFNLAFWNRRDVRQRWLDYWYSDLMRLSTLSRELL